MSQTELILVTGATGQQGGSVINALLDKGFKVRATSRNTTGDAAKSLQARGIDVVEADFTNRTTLDAALKGATGAFLMGTSFEAGAGAETEHGKNFIDAAKDAGINHLVYTSVSDADRNTGIPHFDSKYEVEKHLAASGVAHTIIAPAFFYDNHLSSFMLPGLQNGTYAVAMPANASLQMVSVNDIGKFAALAFSKPDHFIGKRVNIAGDEMKGNEYAAALSRRAGKSIQYFEVPIEQVRQMSEDMALMYEWFVSVGYSADIPGLRKQYPEVGWESFADWSARQDWSVLEAEPVTG